MATKKENDPSLRGFDARAAIMTPLTTDLAQRYGRGDCGLPMAQQVARDLIRRLARDIVGKRQAMTGARAIKDHPLRSMVAGLTQLVINTRSG